MKRLFNNVVCSIISINLLLLTGDFKSYAADFTNHIGMKFNSIPRGSFLMGSCKENKDDEKRRFLGLPSQGCKPTVLSKIKIGEDKIEENELPAHKVTITNKFQIGVYEVTLGEFKKFISKSKNYNLLNNEFIKINKYGNNVPVTYVSWNDVQLFLKWLNKTKINSDKGVYRLPTEAEWEYAARASTTTTYSWGNNRKDAKDYAVYNWFRPRYYPTIQTIGQKKPNLWGIYDMHGNVWEWVQDWYDKDFYKNSPLTDPKGPKIGKFKVFRGGCWFDSAKFLRVGYRSGNLKKFKNDTVGFRVVREIN